MVKSALRIVKSTFFLFLFLSHSWHSQKALESSLPALEAPLCHQLQQLEAPESSLSSTTAYSAHSFKGSKVQSEQSLAKSSLPNFEFCFFFYSPPPPPPPLTHTQKAQPKSSGVKPFTYNSIFSPQPQRLLLSPVSSHRSEQFLASSSLSKCFFPLLSPHSRHSQKALEWNHSSTYGILPTTIKAHNPNHDSFCPAPGLESGTAEQSCPSAPTQESGTETGFIKLVSEVVNPTHLWKKEAFLQPTSFSCSHVPQSQWILLNFFLFDKFLRHHEQAPMLHTHGGFSWGVC